MVAVLSRIAMAEDVDDGFRAYVDLFNVWARRLGPEFYVSNARLIRETAKLWPYRPRASGQRPFCVTDPDLPNKVPGVAWLYLFHADGRFREAALHHIPPEVPSGFHLFALAYRQNDWAEPVRHAAREAFRRVDTNVSAMAIASAALRLWIEAPKWGRCDANLILDMLRDPPVFRSAVGQIAREGTSSGLAALRQMLRHDDIDPHLSRLATSAHVPAIRRVALTTLASGEARILTGYTRVWVDKSMGHTRREPVFDIRPVTVEADAADLCLAALDDTATHVQAAALDGLMHLGKTDLIPAGRLDALADGPVYRLAWRADYIRRQRTGT